MPETNKPDSPYFVIGVLSQTIKDGMEYSQQIKSLVDELRKSIDAEESDVLDRTMQTIDKIKWCAGRNLSQSQYGLEAIKKHEQAHFGSEDVMKTLTVTEEIEIILDGKKYLLEKGDRVVIEHSTYDDDTEYWDREPLRKRMYEVVDEFLDGTPDHLEIPMNIVEAFRSLTQQITEI